MNDRSCEVLGHGVSRNAALPRSSKFPPTVLQCTTGRNSKCQTYDENGTHDRRERCEMTMMKCVDRKQNAEVRALSAASR